MTAQQEAYCRSLAESIVTRTRKLYTERGSDPALAWWTLDQNVIGSVMCGAYHDQPSAVQKALYDKTLGHIRDLTGYDGKDWREFVLGASE